MTSETLRSHETTQRLVESCEVRWPSVSTVHAATMTLPGTGHSRRLWTDDARGAALLGGSRFGFSTECPRGLVWGRWGR